MTDNPRRPPDGLIRLQHNTRAPSRVLDGMLYAWLRPELLWERSPQDHGRGGVHAHEFDFERDPTNAMCRAGRRWHFPPKFTEEIAVITGELEARGWQWWASSPGRAGVLAPGHEPGAEAENAGRPALALCRALVLLGTRVPLPERRDLT